MLLWNNDFHTIFWVAVIPGVLSIALLWFGLSEPKTPSLINAPIRYDGKT